MAELVFFALCIVGVFVLGHAAGAAVGLGAGPGGCGPSLAIGLLYGEFG